MRGQSSIVRLPGADLLGELDDASFGTADVAQPEGVLVILDLADQANAVGAQSVDDRVQVMDDEGDMRMPS